MKKVRPSNLCKQRMVLCTAPAAGAAAANIGHIPRSQQWE